MRTGRGAGRVAGRGRTWFAALAGTAALLGAGTASAVESDDRRGDRNGALKRGGGKVGADDLAAFKTETKRYRVESGQFGDGNVVCPDGTRLISGGAYLAAPGEGPDAADLVFLADSAPTPRGNGWFAEGFNDTAEAKNLVVSADCLPATKRRGGKVGADDLAASKLRLRSREQGGGDTGGGNTACPTGGRALSGGVYFDGGGQRPDDDDGGYVAGAGPVAGGGAWYGTAYNAQDGGTRDSIVSALCLPATERRSGKVGGDDLAGFELTKRILPIPSGSQGGQEAECERGSRLIAGGAYAVSDEGEPIPGAPVTLMASSANSDRDGWYASALNESVDETKVMIVAQCLPRTGG